MSNTDTDRLYGALSLVPTAGAAFFLTLVDFLFLSLLSFLTAMSLKDGTRTVCDTKDMPDGGPNENDDAGGGDGDAADAADDGDDDGDCDDDGNDPIAPPNINGAGDDDARPIGRR